MLRLIQTFRCHDFACNVLQRVDAVPTKQQHVKRQGTVPCCSAASAHSCLTRCDTLVLVMRFCGSALCSLRMQWYEAKVPCNASAAITSADALFRRKGRAARLLAARGSNSRRKHGQVSNTPYMSLGGRCSLLARKFGAASVPAILSLAADCERGFGWGSACVGAL